MPRKMPKENINPYGGSTGLEAEKIKLKLTAHESLAIVKKLEQERIDAGTHGYETNYDQYGKMFRTLVKKQP